MYVIALVCFNFPWTNFVGPQVVWGSVTSIDMVFEKNGHWVGESRDYVLGTTK